MGINTAFASGQRRQTGGAFVHRRGRGRLDQARGGCHSPAVPARSCTQAHVEDIAMTNQKGPIGPISEGAADAIATAQRLATDLPKAARRKVSKLETKLTAAGQREVKRRRQLAKAEGRPKREQRRQKQLAKAVGRVAGLVEQLAEAVGHRLPVSSADGSSAKRAAAATSAAKPAATKPAAAKPAVTKPAVSRPGVATPAATTSAAKPAAARTLATKPTTARTRSRASAGSSTSSRPAGTRATTRGSSTRSTSSQPRRRSLRPNADGGKQPDG
jgi:hypothetical protein